MEMIGRKNTRLALAKWLASQGVDCGTTPATCSIRLGSKFTLNGQVLQVVDASSTNTWGGGNGLMKLEVAA